MKLVNLKNLTIQEAKEITGGGDLIRAFWYVIGMAGSAYGHAITNERNSGGSVINWKN